MAFNFNNETPIYIQIIEHIKMQIISGEYKSNDKLPSVRELSVAFSVNPNTVQKALAELESMGLIYTERTNGKFVTNNQEVINEETNRSVKNIINGFYSAMAKVGLDKKAVLEILSREEIE